jgi:hypothetical protein
MIGRFKMRVIRKIAVVLSVLVLSSCGELPIPDDWGERLDFSEKPYAGDLFDIWDDFIANETGAEPYVSYLDKAQHWKGSGTIEGDEPVCYVLNAKKSARITIDWTERERSDLTIDYRKISGSVTKDYGFSTSEISMGKDDYLIIRISPSRAEPADWEIGFIVE